MKLIKEICVSWRAEVVFITSNYEGTQEMMERCKEAGIPAFVRHRFVLFRLFFFLHLPSRERCGISKELFAHGCFCIILLWQQDSAIITRFTLIDL